MPITWPWGDQLIMTDEGLIKSRGSICYRILFSMARLERRHRDRESRCLEMWRQAVSMCQPIALGRMDTEGGCYAASNMG